MRKSFGNHIPPVTPEKAAYKKGLRDGFNDGVKVFADSIEIAEAENPAANLQELIAIVKDLTARAYP